MGKLTSLATILKGNHVLTKLIVWHGELKNRLMQLSEINMARAKEKSKLDLSLKLDHHNPILIPISFVTKF